MSNQGALFEIPADEPKPWQTSKYPLYDGTPPHEAPATSREAAESVAPVTGILQRQVLDAIRARGAEGATDDELEQDTGLRHQSLSARRRELYLLGKIRSIGTRRTRSGRRAQVWVVA